MDDNPYKSPLETDSPDPAIDIPIATRRMSPFLGLCCLALAAVFGVLAALFMATMGIALPGAWFSMNAVLWGITGWMVLANKCQAVLVAVVLDLLAFASVFAI